MHCSAWTVSHIDITFVDNFTNFEKLVNEMPCAEYYIANHVIWVITRVSVGKTVAV